MPDIYKPRKRTLKQKQPYHSILVNNKVGKFCFVFEIAAKVYNKPDTTATKCMKRQIYF